MGGPLQTLRGKPPGVSGEGGKAMGGFYRNNKIGLFFPCLESLAALWGKQEWLFLGTLETFTIRCMLKI